MKPKHAALSLCIYQIYELAKTSNPTVKPTMAIGIYRTLTPACSLLWMNTNDDMLHFADFSGKQSHAEKTQ